MKASDVERALELLMEALSIDLRAVARTGRKLLEEQRGKAYGPDRSRHHEDGIYEEAQVWMRHRLEESLPGVVVELPFPDPPEDALALYDQQVRHHKYEHVTGRSDWNPPPKPNALTEYELKKEVFAEALRFRLKSSGLGWKDPEFQRRLAENLVSAVKMRRPARKNRRRARSKATPVDTAGELVGDDSTECIAQEELRESARKVARKLLGFELAFAEEIQFSSGTLATLARDGESSNHRKSVQEAVGVLKRLGYEVYPGDVGIDGYHAMADLVAWDESSVWFIECLTKASIKFGAHERKLLLARRVPFCFVGDLPDDFARALPPNAHALRRPDSAFTHRNEVPPFWLRSPDQKPLLVVQCRRKRVLCYLSLAIAQLRLSEDATGYLCHYLWRGWRGRDREGFNIRLPITGYGVMPFKRYESPNTKYQLKSASSELELRLGSLPLRGHLRGTTAALDSTCDALRAAGLQVHVEFVS